MKKISNGKVHEKSEQKEVVGLCLVHCQDKKGVKEMKPILE